MFNGNTKLIELASNVMILKHQTLSADLIFMTSKKRQRIVLSCDNCHKRKIKCDRKYPCNSCTDRGIASLCRYSSLENEYAKQGPRPNYVVDGGMNLDPQLTPGGLTPGEIVQLREKVRELEASIGVASLSTSTIDSTVSPIRCEDIDPQETTHFFSRNSKDDSSFKLKDLHSLTFPISFHSLLRQDPVHAAFWHGKRLTDHREKYTRYLSEGVGTIMDDDDATTKSYAEESQAFFGTTFIPEVVNNVKPSPATKRSINEYFGDQDPVVFYDGYLRPNGNLHLKLSFILPPKSIILEYVSVWFALLDPFFPVFERNSFLSKLSSSGFLQERNEGSDNPRVKLNIDKKLDLALLASLLFMLRLTYLHLNKAKASTLAYDHFLKYPIYLELPCIAKECLKEFQITHIIDIEVLQAFTMAKVYKTFSQDEADGFRECETVIEALLNAGVMCGLSRDPDIYIHDDLSWLAKTHRRKLWFFLVWMEFGEVSLLGRSPFNLSSSDVRLEEINIPHDNSLYNTIKRILPIRNLMVEIVGLLTNITKPVNLLKFISLRTDVSNLIDQKFGDLQTLVQAAKGSLDSSYIIQVYDCLSLKLLLLKLNYSLYLIFDKKGDTTHLFYFYKQLFQIMFADIAPVVSTLFGLDPKIDSRFSVIVGSMLPRICFIFIMFCATSIVHLAHTMAFYEGVEDKTRYVRVLSDNIKKAWQYVLSFNGPIARKSYLSWRAMKAMVFTLSEITSFNLVYGSKLTSWQYNNYQIHELLEIVSESLDLLRSPESLVYENSDILWLNITPYDKEKLIQDNLHIQRLHICQIDAKWFNCIAELRESVPESFQSEEVVDNTQIPNLLNSVIMDPASVEIARMSTGFSLEDFFINDSQFKN